MKEFEHEGEKFAPGEIIELPPRPAVEKIEDGVVREASWTDFEG